MINSRDMKLVVYYVVDSKVLEAMTLFFLNTPYLYFSRYMHISVHDSVGSEFLSMINYHDTKLVVYYVLDPKTFDVITLFTLYTFNFLTLDLDILFHNFLESDILSVVYYVLDPNNFE